MHELTAAQRDEYARCIEAGGDGARMCVGLSLYAEAGATLDEALEQVLAEWPEGQDDDGV